MLLRCAPADPGGGGCGPARRRRGAGGCCRLLDALPMVAGLLELHWSVLTPATTTFLGFPHVCWSSPTILRHARSAIASEVFVLGSGRNPRAATACAVNGDARGCRHLLGGVGMTLTRSPPRAPGEILGPASRTGQRRRLNAVPLLMALLWLQVEYLMRQIVVGDASLWRRLLHKEQVATFACAGAPQ